MYRIDTTNTNRENSLCKTDSPNKYANVSNTQTVKPIEDQYITMENFETHSQKFNTKAKIKIVGEIKVNRYNMIVQAFNKIPEAMKKNVEILQIESPTDKNSGVNGEWYRDTKTMSLMSHESFEQNKYDHVAFHEAAHSKYEDYTEEQIKEWFEKVKGLHMATEYAHSHYMKWIINKKSLLKYQTLEKSYMSYPNLAKELDRIQKLINPLESENKLLEEIYSNEMYAEAYSWKYCPPSDPEFDKSDPSCREELLEIFGTVFEL